MERSCFSEKTLTLSVLTAEFARCVLQTGAPVTARSFLLRGLPMTARQELLLAAAGPLANLLACAAVLHYKKETVAELKEDIRAGGVEVRRV